MDRQLIQFALAIPTYNRPHLLKLLLQDIFNQSLIPSFIIIIDGNPKTNDVQSLLRSQKNRNSTKILYIPSNHPNLAYQRYLGWKCVEKFTINYLLYLDDDLRLHQADTIENLIKNLEADNCVAGVTCQIRFGKMESTNEDYNRLHSDKFIPYGRLVRWLGYSHNLQPGGITPIGNRIPPTLSDEISTQEVQWLRGGVMLYRMSFIDLSCFSEDLFALDHIHCGKGEDTFLSRQLMTKGKLLLDSSIIVDHPNLDLPKTYPVDAFHFGYASAYSRRFLNDHYRMTSHATPADRIALIWAYAGNNLLNFYSMVKKPAGYRKSYAWGYFKGSLRGLLQKPTAKNLTPGINWWKDAEQALAQVIEIK